MPPPVPAATIFSSPLASAIRTSVVSISETMDAAFWRARRVTFAGSITPALTRSPNSPVSALKPKFSSFDSRTRPTTIAPSCPAFWAIWRMGSSSARFTMFTPMASSSWSLSFSRAGKQRRRAVPPPETMPSSTAARVACMASSTRAFFSFSSVSVDAPNQLGKTFLELFLVVIRGGLFDLHTELLDSAFDLAGLASARDDRRVVLVDGHLLGAAQVLNLQVLELRAEILGDGFAAGEDRDVLEHGLATIAKARGFHCSALQRAAEFVDDERCQGFAVDVLSDDQERLAHLGGLFEQWQQILHRADLLFVDQDVHVLEYTFHALRIGHKVGREVAAVKLHAFDHFERRLHRLGFLDGDDAILTNLLHRFGDDAAYLLVGVGTDGANLRDHVALHLAGQPLDLSHGNFNGLIDAALERHRACTCGHRSYTLTEDCLCQHGRGGGAIASYIRGLGRNLAHHPCTHVLERVLQLDLLCHRHAVFGDDRSAKLLLDYRVAPLRAQRDFHRVSQNVDAAQNRLT